MSESVWMAGPGEAMRRPLRGDFGESVWAEGAAPSPVFHPLSVLPSLCPCPCDLGQRGACLLPLLASRLGVFRVGWVSPFSSQEKQGGLGVRSRHKAGRP